MVKKYTDESRQHAKAMLNPKCLKTCAQSMLNNKWAVSI